MPQVGYCFAFRFLVRLCNTPSSFKRYAMQPNVFLGYLVRAIVGVLSSFGHEQYPSNSVNPSCLIIKYN